MQMEMLLEGVMGWLAGAVFTTGTCKVFNEDLLQPRRVKLQETPYIISTRCEDSITEEHAFSLLCQALSLLHFRST